MRLTIWCALGLFIARANAGEVEALAISANIQARHLPFGTILDPIFVTPGGDQIASYARCGDSAIWTGHYLAAEAFRYNVTQSPDALDQVKRALAGLKSLVDVTGTNLLARCLVPLNSQFAAGIQSQEAANGIYTNASAGWFWVGNTSRDQYMGAIFGLGVAYDMVDDPGVKSSISQLVTRMVDFLNGHGWTVIMPDGRISTSFLLSPDQILDLLQVGRHVNSSHFSFTYSAQRILLAATVPAPIAVDVANDDSYFKFNLDYVTLYNLIRLESSSANIIYRSAYDILRGHTAGHQNAFFNVIDRALNGPNAARDIETLALLDAWLQRPKRDNRVDLHGAVAICGDQACAPVPVPLRPPTDFLWQRNPFQLAGGGDGFIESAGIDYILPYWMARFYGVQPAFEVRSAGATGLPVATGSIGTILGANLAGTTEQASLQPLPATLAGISLTVRDTAGVEREAHLMYVSPGQINFVIPEGTAPGLATFVVSNGGITLSAAGTVKSVAPALFALNGKGTGLAAATATRVQTANPQLQGPVEVFQCDASDCVATPIDLGVDTTVYLALYGTGIRNRSSLANLNVTINATNAPVLYAGPQPSFEGLDQVNVALPLNLRGSGDVNIVLTVDGQASNTVTVSVK